MDDCDKCSPIEKTNQVTVLKEDTVCDLSGDEALLCPKGLEIIELFRKDCSVCLELAEVHKRALSNPKIKKIDIDSPEGAPFASKGLTKTPTFLVNGVPFEAREYEDRLFIQDAKTKRRVWL